MKKYLALLFLFIMISIFINIPVNASMANIDLIYTNPAETCATEMNISWHSSEEKNNIYYTTDDDILFNRATKLEVIGEINKTNYSNNSNYYHCKVHLTNLSPNTKYIYKVSNSKTTSDVHTFKTAGINGNFNFAIIGDVHSNSSEKAKITNSDLIIEAAENETKNNGGIDFVLSCGDLVKYGEIYSDWQQWNNSKTTKKYMLASAIGNHEYYNASKVRSTNNWFNEAYYNPKNGVEGLDSTYWFLYNNVLFISMDTICEEANQIDINVKNNNLQKEWFEYVINKNEGKYQYIIVFKHYPDFTIEDTTAYSSYKYGNYLSWYKLYDKYNVDYVISGDSHCYVRSNHLYNNDITTSKKQGTVYLTCPQLYTSWYTTSIVDVVSNPLLSVFHTGATTGGLFFEVSTSSIKMNLISYINQTDYEIYDSDIVYAKRSYPINKYIDLFKSTLTYTSDFNKSNGYIDYSDYSAQFVEKISVYNGNELLSTVEPSKTNSHTISLTSLNVDTTYQLVLKVVYINKEIEDINLNISTYGYCGYIDNTKIIVDRNNVVLSWDEYLEENVDKLEIYIDDIKITSLDKNVKVYSIDKNLNHLTLNAVYTIKALSSTNDVLFTKSFTYNLLGDANFDGLIDNDDIITLSEAILNNKNFNTNEYLLFDINNDTRISVYDVKTINDSIINNSKLEKEFNTFVVIFIDMNNNIISTQEIKYNDNAILPNIPIIDGYRFESWSLSNKNITKSIIIRALYSKE